MFLLRSMSRYEGYAMGMRTKSNPQSCIHRSSSSVVCFRAREGSGEKKSRRLNPFHAGSGFFFGVASAEVPYKPRAVAPKAVVAMKCLRFMSAEMSEMIFLRLLMPCVCVQTLMIRKFSILRQMTQKCYVSGAYVRHIVPKAGLPVAA